MPPAAKEPAGDTQQSKAGSKPPDTSRSPVANDKRTAQPSPAHSTGQQTPAKPAVSRRQTPAKVKPAALGQPGKASSLSDAARPKGPISARGPLPDIARTPETAVIPDMSRIPSTPLPPDIPLGADARPTPDASVASDAKSGHQASKGDINPASVFTLGLRCQSLLFDLLYAQADASARTLQAILQSPTPVGAMEAQLDFMRQTTERAIQHSLAAAKLMADAGLSVPVEPR
jgi:hypothetical protein